MSGVGEQSRYEGTLREAQPNPLVVLDILDTKAAVLELTAAAAGTRILATDRRRRRPFSRGREVRSRFIFSDAGECLSGSLFLRELVYALM